MFYSHVKREESDHDSHITLHVFAWTIGVKHVISFV